MFGIREDDPIFAMIAILGEFEKGMFQINKAISNDLQDKIDTIDKKFGDFKEAISDSQPLTDRLESLDMNLIDTSQNIQALDDHVGLIKKLGEQVTQTGYMDRMMKMLAPAFGALIGVVVGFISAAVVFMVVLKR